MLYEVITQLVQTPRAIDALELVLATLGERPIPPKEKVAHRGGYPGCTVRSSLLHTRSEVHRKARLGRNPKTGETIQIPAKTVVKFRIAKAAKEAILKK